MSKEKIKMIQNLWNSTSRSNLILNIKRLREEKNITQKQLAELTGIPYQTITKIEIWVIKEPSVYSCLKNRKVFLSKYGRACLRNISHICGLCSISWIDFTRKNFFICHNLSNLLEIVLIHFRKELLSLCLHFVFYE